MSQKENKPWSEVHLDALRGLAAIIVMLGHARGLFFQSTDSNAVVFQATASSAIAREAHLTTGHAAVMFFFVLSGYLVGGSVLNASRSGSWCWSNYLIKRLTRLWVVLIPAVLIGILFDVVGSNLLNLPGSIYTAPAGQDFVKVGQIGNSSGISSILGNIFFLQGIFFPTVGTNGPLWSLSLEFWYYIMFPLIFMGVLRGRKTLWRVAACAGCIAIAIAIGANGSYLFFVWLLGAGAAALPWRVPPPIAGVTVLATGVFSIVVFIALRGLHLGARVDEAVFGFAAAALVYAVSCQNHVANASLYTGLAGFFSKISYTLYLTHLPFLIFICAVLNSPWKVWSWSPHSIAWFLVVNALAIVWAVALYFAFEARTGEIRVLLLSILARARSERVL